MSEFHINKEFEIYNQDCITKMHEFQEEGRQFDFSVFSPPFSSLYTYTDKEEDMGNSKNSDDEFLLHFKFFSDALFPLIKDGRNVCVHVQNPMRSKADYGNTEIWDMRGDMIRLFRDSGFLYHGEVSIFKNPQSQSIRTKSQQLQFGNFLKDSNVSRPALLDYLLIFKKPGENKVPITSKTYQINEHGAKERTDVTNQNWIDWASGIWGSDIEQFMLPYPFHWFNIRETDTLNYRAARSENDMRHICLAKDSLVLTKEGHKHIQDVCIGDLVLTHKGRWRKVIVKKMTGVNPTVVVKAHGVYDLRLTPTHKVWARNSLGMSRPKDRAKKAEPGWVEAKNLNGCYVNTKLPPIEENEYSEKEWWIIGRWIADGHFDTKGSAHISCGDYKLQEFFDMVGDVAGNCKSNTQGCTQIFLKDPTRRIRKVLDKCGKHAHEKKLPPEAFTLNKDLAKSLLDGYLSGDGHYNKSRNRWYASSASKELLIGLKFLVQRVTDQVASIHAGRSPRIVKFPHGKSYECKQEWILSFGGVSHSFSFIESDGAWKKVKSVKDAEPEETWNLRVEEDESYTADGCIVKNCPLQLDLIERCVRLWSNEGETVFSPFAGIGSEGYESLKFKRKYVGTEIKEEYYQEAIKNCESAIEERDVSINRNMEIDL